MHKSMDEKELSQYRKYVKDKLAAFTSLLAHVPLQNLPGHLPFAKDADLVTLYNGILGMAEAIDEAQAHKIEAMCQRKEALQQRVVELSLSYAALQTKLVALKESEAEMRRQNIYLTGLKETAQELMNCLEVNQVLQTVLQRATDVLEAPHGYICLLTTGEIMEIKFGVGLYDL